MTIVLSDTLNGLVQQRLATGRYASLEDLLQKALRQLGYEEQLMDELRAAAEDEAAGRLISVEDFDREVRAARGWAS